MIMDFLTSQLTEVSPQLESIYILLDGLNGPPRIPLELKSSIGETKRLPDIAPPSNFKIKAS